MVFSGKHTTTLHVSAKFPWHIYLKSRSKMGVCLVPTWSSSSIWNWVKMWWRKARTTGKAGPWSSAISGDSRSRFSAPRMVAVS